MPRDADQYDFFVSYARRDNSNNWITGFVDGILTEHKAFSGGRELTCFFDKDEIRSGQDWQHRIHHGVAESRVFLAFISPNYFASEWCQREWRAWIDTEIAKHVFSDGAAPVYIVQVPGFEHDASPLIRQLQRRQFVSVHSFYSEGVNALRRADLRQVLAKLANDIDDRADRVRQAAESANTVPPYNKSFSGRVDELLDLRQRLKSDLTGVVCGLNGLGGIGKTELAFAYAHAFASVYPGGRLLVPCDGKATIREAALSLDAFADFRAAITDEERKTPDSLFAAVSSCLARRLEEKGSILLVLDNVTSMALMTEQETDELTKLGPWLHLLMTTRLAPPVGGNWLTLGELSEVDAMDLLEKHRPFAAHEREAAQRIVKRLGGFAMAVELVAAFLAAHEGSTYGTLAERIGLGDLETIAADATTELRRHNHERRLTAVLEPVLADLSDVERRTLEMASFLPPDTVALPWLKALVEGDFPNAFAPAGLITEPWTEVCSRLTRLALFSRSSAEETWRVRVHRLVQELVKRGMSPERLAACQSAVDALVRARAAALRETTRWETARWEVEALDALAVLWAETRHGSGAWLLSQAGIRWRGVAEWARAEPVLRLALGIDEASYGQDHPRVAAHLNNLAVLLEATNRLVEAERLMRRALRIDEAGQGANHPNVAIDLNNLAQLLQATNRLSEAEPLMWRALGIDEASYGPNQPRVAVDLGNLAKLFYRTNRLSEAEPLMWRALGIDEASYGADHPNVAIRLNSLTALLSATNRMSEAEPLMRRALQIDQASYGPDHPRVAIDLNNLAQLLKATNRLREAEPLMRRALGIDEASYGMDHPDVARDLNNLARLLQDTNRLNDAEPLMRRQLEIFLIFTRSTHHEHPRLREAVMNYAGLLRTIKLSERKILDKLSSLGPEPPALFREQNRPTR